MDSPLYAPELPATAQASSMQRAGCIAPVQIAPSAAPGVERAEGAGGVSHVVDFSGGVCSFWAAKRVVERHGREGVVLLFADVLIEDPDLYRFSADVAAHLGVSITRISKELTPWQLFAAQGMIGNSRAPLCSIMLKREPLDEWHRANCREFTTTLHFGIDWTEEHRLRDLRKRYPTWRCEAPMCDEPLWDKCRMLAELDGLGIKPPALYKFGFPHNNCGGFCVKAGQAQFALLLRTHPERYAMHEAEEEKLRAQLGDFSVMKDRRGKTQKPLPMRVLRERIEAGESFDREDWGGCGCALDSEPVRSGGGGGVLVGEKPPPTEKQYNK